MDELDEKLRNKFAVPEATALAFLALLKRKATVTHPSIVLNVVSDDPDDKRVLECAVAGEANFIVSDDKHLLRLGAHAGIAIFTARQFLETAGFRVE